MALKVHIAPHNDLSNLAHFIRGVINEKEKEGNAHGIALDCMSAIVALAFFVEAIVNFVGFKKVDGWDEWASYEKKIKSLKDTIRFPHNAGKNPYKSVKLLRKLRNEMAHAKPVEKRVTAKTVDEMRKSMETPWDPYLTPRHMNKFYENVKEFERILMLSANISIHDSLTRAFGSLDKPRKT